MSPFLTLARFQYNDMTKVTKSSQSGFTLIEMLVAVGMFALLMTMIISALLTMVYTNRKGNALNLVVTNMYFAMESISRHVHDGLDITC